MYQRETDNLSLNKLFYKSEAPSRQKKVSSFPSYIYDENSVKIYTQGKGVYKLSYDYLLKNGLSHLFTLQTKYLRLFSKDIEVPFQIETGSNTLIDEKDDFILFYAEDHLNEDFEKNNDVYFDPYDYRNVYWLTFDSQIISPAKRLFNKDVSLKEVDNDKKFTPEFYPKSVHIEKNESDAKGALIEIEPEYSNKGFYHHRDFRLWGNELVYNTFVTYDISILDDYYTGSDSIDISVMMTGAENTKISNHSVDIKISKFSYSSPTNLDWKLARKQALRFKVPTSSLKGLNDFAIKNTNTNGDQFLNFVDINFDATFNARDNEIEFTSPKPIFQPGQETAYSVYEFAIENFTTQDILLLEKGESVLKNFIVDIGDEGTYTLKFQDHIENVNAEFVAISRSSIKEPVLAEKQNNSHISYASTGLSSFSSDSEMLILTTDLYKDVANNYKTYKDNSGLSAIVINVDDIYNEYNNGYESPYAIKRFLKDAYEKWSPKNKLKYVLFIGDATRSYKTGNDLNYVIPTFQFLASEKTGYVSSDSYYGFLYSEKDGFLDLDNNPIMDLYIGRIPAQTVYQAQSYLEKLKVYDSALPQAQNLILAGDDFKNTSKNRDVITGKRVFLDQSSRINHQQVPDYNYEILRRASKDNPTETSTVLKTSKELQDIFNSGVNHILFMGHGGGALWDDNQILTQEKAELLENDGRYPVISSMTCFIGAFDDPFRQTLGEILVLEPNKGAIGLLGASGVSLIYNQYMINYYLNVYREKEAYTYGEIISLAKLDYYRKGQNYIVDLGTHSTPQFNVFKNYIVLEFNYLGDPSIRLKSPEKAILETTNTIQANTDQNYTIKNLSSGSYTGIIECFDYLGEEIVKQDISFNGSGDFSQSISIPNLTNETNYYIKGYLKSNSKIYNFGKKVYLSGFGENLDFKVADAETFNEVDFKTSIDSPIRLKLDLENTYEYISLILKTYDINLNEINSIEFTLVDTNNAYFSESSFNLPENVTTVELHNVNGHNGSNVISLTPKYNLALKLGHYSLKTIPNTLNIEYKTNTSIGIGVSYPASYKDSLTSYVNYYRSYTNEFNQRFSDLVSKDTVQFSQMNTSLFSRVTFNESIINGTDLKYYVSLETDSIVKEAFTRNYMDSISVGIFPNYLISESILDSVRLKDGFNLRIDNRDNSIINATRVNFSIVQKDDIKLNTNLLYEILKDGSRVDEFIQINYFNDEQKIPSTDSNTFVFKIGKLFWSDIASDKIALNYYNESISNWIQVETKNVINESDSSLIVYVTGGLRDSGIYALSEITAEKKFRVEVSYEVNGQVTNGVHYSSSKPDIKIRLFSRDEGYVINPDNILLTLVGQPDEALPFSYRYSGENNRNLSLSINSETFDDATSYQIDTKISGYTRISGKNKATESIASQIIKVSLTDDLIVFGNYPNPFSERTILGYQLNSTNSDNSELKIKIYTLSGHLIRTIDTSNADVLESTNGIDEFRVLGNNNLANIGPNYVLWDGLDNEGEKVANGVYFCKFIYQSNGVTKEKIIKLAKIFGVSGGNTVNGL